MPWILCSETLNTVAFSDCLKGGEAELENLVKLCLVKTQT